MYHFYQFKTQIKYFKFRKGKAIYIILKGIIHTLKTGLINFLNRVDILE